MPKGKIHKLDMINICKEFSNILANDHINFSIKAGEILALIGENGAGKTTLMNILFGIYQPDSGEIRINDNSIRITCPRKALDLGIGMVHQHFKLISGHTVCENIALSNPESQFFFPQRKIKKDIECITQKYNFKIDPEAKIWQLSAGEQQRVEILKILIRKTDLIILDEPTSVLTQSESDELFGIMKKLAEEGHSIIIITHKIREVMDFADRAIILRRGKLITELKISEATEQMISESMIDQKEIIKPGKNPQNRGECVLSVKELKVKNDKGFQCVKNISFDVYKNEIFGIAGVSGNGQKELIEAITGLRKIDSGCVRFNDLDITNCPSEYIIGFGISYIPEDRLRFGVIPDMNIYENAILRNSEKKNFSKYGFLSKEKIKNLTEKILSDYHIDPILPDSPIKYYSGGNIQKIILGREISGDTKLIIASHPTYGLDIKSTAFIREKLLKKRDEGIPVLLVSEDLDELLEIADRIAVISKGEIIGVSEYESINLEKISLMMGGVKV